MAWDSAFEVAFHPRSLAIVGVSRGPARREPPFGGLTTLCNLQHYGFRGRIYPINPEAEDVCGIRAYPDLKAVPEPLDLVIIAVPAAAVPSVLEDCVAADARNVHVMTSAFSETQFDEGAMLETRMREIAIRGGLRLIGPNCMGLQVPKARMATFNDVPLNHGPVAFVSQSGGHVHYYLLMGRAYGFGFSKVISYGNGLVMDSPDFLEYLAQDPDTRIICLYLEGVGDGERLVEIVREISPAKPVVVWKAGLTRAGAQAALSHTGSLGGAREVWDAFFKQTGAIRVNSIEEMAAVTMTLLHLQPPRSRRVAIVGVGGGNSVASGDTCAEAGLEAPALAQKSRSELLSFVSIVNQSVTNPLDIPLVVSRPERLQQVLEIVAADPNIDAIIINQLLGVPSREGSQTAADVACNFVQGSPYHKPILAVIPGANALGVSGSSELQERLLSAAIPVYSSLSSACRALRCLIEYQHFLEGRPSHHGEGIG